MDLFPQKRLAARNFLSQRIDQRHLELLMCHDMKLSPGKFKMTIDVNRLREALPEFDFENFQQDLIKYRDIIDTGKLAEFYCEKLFGLSAFRSAKSQNIRKNGPHDANTPCGERVEIKYRAPNSKTPPGMKLNFANFDFVLYVLLDENLLPSRIWRIRKCDITQTKNPGDWSDTYDGRVSFRNALRDHKAEQVF